VSTTVRQGDYVPMTVWTVLSPGETRVVAAERIQQDLNERYPGYMFGVFFDREVGDGHTAFSLSVLRRWRKAGEG